MRLWIAAKLTDLGWWCIDLAESIREIAGAVAHARSHPTDLQDR